MEQTADGKNYAAVYNDDGKFYMRTFGKKSRDPEEALENELDINSLLSLNNHTMCIQTFPDPFITCCFVGDSSLFINLFYNPTLTHYHFLYDLDSKKIIGKPV